MVEDEAFDGYVFAVLDVEEGAGPVGSGGSPRLQDGAAR